MRVEVKCSRCKASVLVLDVEPGKPDKAGKVKPDQDDLTRKIQTAGWKPNAKGGVCTEH